MSVILINDLILIIFYSLDKLDTIYAKGRSNYITLIIYCWKKISSDCHAYIWLHKFAE